MAMNELRIGVLGVGGRGGLAGHAHRPEDRVRVVAGADPRAAALDHFRERYGPDTFTTADYRDLLAHADVNVVFVTAPDFLHEEMAVAALEAGKAVYLEKPIAITIAGADRILEAAVRTGAKLYLGHNMRHMVVVQKMKEIIDAGLIGAVKAAWCRHFVGHGGDFYYKDWHADRRKSTGLLLQKATHDIDVLHWLCGGYARRVTGMGGLTLYGQIAHRTGDGAYKGTSDAHWPPLTQSGFNPVVDVEDLSMMLMELDNGVLCSYEQCHYTPDYWRNYTFIGTEGRIENFGDGSEDTVIRLWNRRTNYNAAGDRQFPAPASAGSHGGADPKIVDEFIRYVRGQCAPSTSPVAARYSVAAGCMATDSLRNGNVPRDVPPLDPQIAAHFVTRSGPYSPPGRSAA
jgi:predicted dehydrogenase